MKRSLILAALAATLAAPVAASPLADAVAHFNQDRDTANEMITVPAQESYVTVSTRNGSSLDTAFDIFNRSADSRSELRGLNGATVYDATPAYGGDVFDRIRAESADDE
jgi:hypothetical protein